MSIVLIYGSAFYVEERWIIITYIPMQLIYHDDKLYHYVKFGKIRSRRKKSALKVDVCEKIDKLNTKLKGIAGMLAEKLFHVSALAYRALGKTFFDQTAK